VVIGDGCEEAVRVSTNIRPRVVLALSRDDEKENVTRFLMRAWSRGGLCLCRARIWRDADAGIGLRCGNRV